MMLAEWIALAVFTSPMTIYGTSIVVRRVSWRIRQRKDYFASLRERTRAVLDKKIAEGAVYVTSKLSPELYGEVYQTAEWWDAEFKKLLEKVEPKRDWVIEKSKSGYGVMRVSPTDSQKALKHALANNLMREAPNMSREHAMALASDVVRGMPGATTNVHQALTAHRAAREAKKSVGDLVAAAEAKARRRELEALECDECEYVEHSTYADERILKRVSSPCPKHQMKFSKFSLTA